MSYAYVWPPGLPQKPNQQYSETSGVNVLRTQPDAGPAKMRRRSNRVQTMQLSFDMTTAQVGTLEAFVEDTLRGTARFGFVHPRTGATVEARVVPDSDGKFFDINYYVEGYWKVAITFEILP